MSPGIPFDLPIKQFCFYKYQLVYWRPEDEAEFVKTKVDVPLCLVVGFDSLDQNNIKVLAI